MKEIGVVMSEYLEEPGMIIPTEFGKHLFSTLPIKQFQIELALNTKLYLDISRLILDKSIKRLIYLGLG